MGHAYLALYSILTTPEEKESGTFVDHELNGLVQDSSKCTFSGKIFFPSKVPEFLYVLFNLVVKH